MNPRYEYRALLACDIAGSAGRGEQRLQEIRSVLRSALSGALGSAQLDERDFAYVDTGDGCQLVAPAGLTKARLLVPLLPVLNSRIREHNRHAAPEVRMRVRVAAHAGEIRVDPEGTISGAPFEALARLLDSDALRQATLTDTSGTPVVAILSHHFHEDAVGHGHEGLDADAFSEATVQVKEYAATAWLWYPGSPVGPRVDAGRETDPGLEAGSGSGAGSGAGSGLRAAAPLPGTVEQLVRAEGRSTVFAVGSNGVQNIHDNRRS
ncbi:hypothetical protein [Streptacidiphilus melanogenes]|uniref:hypothetical protein n=1 Tax=Streptacidiphilus melanogenes TaxID=411235 RepID=UPI0005A78E99|nr:hypothetical protein [Streptacidiphilus melanogenes]